MKAARQWTWTLMAVTVLGVSLGSMGKLRAQSVPSQVNFVMRQLHELVANLEFRRAERLSLDAIAGFQKQAVPPAGYRRITTQLGEVYLSSDMDERAVTYLADAWRQLGATERPSRADLRDLVAVTVSLARARANLSQQENAIEVVRSTLLEPRSPALELAGQIELTTKLAILGATHLGPEADSPSLAGEISRLEQQLKPELERGGMRQTDYARSLHCLAEYRQSQLEYDQAVSTLLQLVSLGKESELEGHRAIAAVHRAAGDIKREIEALDLAAASADKLAEGKPMRTFEQSEVSRATADALTRDKQYAQANKLLVSAEQDYQALLRFINLKTTSKDATTSKASASNSISVAKLELEQRLASVLNAILKLPGFGTPPIKTAAIEANVLLRDSYLKQLLPDDPRIAVAQMALGELFLDEGDSGKALGELLAASKFWTSRPDRSHLMRAITLSLLAKATLANQRATDAEGYLRDAEKICREYLSDDELRWWIQLNRARLATTRGKYQLARDIFQALPRGPDRDRLSKKLQSSMALQESLLCKQLADFEQAEELSREALTIRQTEVDPLSTDLLPYYAALSGIYIAQRQPEKLAEVVSVASRICQNLPANDERTLNSRHAGAMVSFFRYEAAGAPSTQGKSDAEHYEQARALWSDLLKDCPQTIAESTIRVRVLHQLSRLEYLKWSRDRAARLAELTSGVPSQRAAFDDALEKYEASRQAFKDAQERLEQRASQYELDRDRFQNEGGRIGSLQERRQKRKQLTETLASLKKTKDELRALKLKLSDEADRFDLADKQRTDAIRKTSDALSASADYAQSALKALGDTDAYVNLRFAVLCDSGRALHARSAVTGDDDDRTTAMNRLRSAIALAETARLESSSDAEKRAEFFTDYQLAFDLLVDFHAAVGQIEEALVAAERCRSLTLLDQRRALDLDLGKHSDDGRVAVQNFLGSGQALLYYYVGGQRSYVFYGGGGEEWNHAVLQAPDGSDVRYGEIDDHVRRLHGALMDPLGSVDSMRERLTGISLVLLPQEVREFLKSKRASGASHVMVVPHGKLSQLPLEGLVMAAGSEEDFVADISPPMAYVPSLTLWNRLSAATDASVGAGPALVSVGMSLQPSPVEQATFESGANERILALEREALQNPPKFAKLECNEIAKAFSGRFAASKATVIVGSEATEARLRELLDPSTHQAPSILHIVAHGKVDDGAAWIQLLPSGNTLETDGRLELADIYVLKLRGCELTVLSACETNLNSSRKSILDPSFSLASGFLAVGARRVLATEWEVGQESTTELVRDFVKRVIDAPAGKGKVNYVQLLAEARGALRENPAHPEWRHPYYWAPFVLIGPAEGDSFVPAR